jgi:hypothetical protein
VAVASTLTNMASLSMDSHNLQGTHKVTVQFDFGMLARIFSLLPTHILSMIVISLFIAFFSFSICATLQ